MKVSASALPICCFEACFQQERMESLLLSFRENAYLAHAEHCSKEASELSST